MPFVNMKEMKQLEDDKVVKILCEPWKDKHMFFDEEEEDVENDVKLDEVQVNKVRGTTKSMAVMRG